MVRLVICQGNEIGLVTVDALVVSGVERAGFFWIEREIAEALTGAHFSWAQDQVIGFHGADGVAVLGEGELDGCQGVPGFEPSYFGLAESVKFLEGQGASAAVGGEIGTESGDALEEVLGASTRNGEHFKPGRKSRGVVHLIGWAAYGTRFSARSLLCPRLDSGDPPDALEALSRAIRQHSGRSSCRLANRL